VVPEKPYSAPFLMTSP